MVLEAAATARAEGAQPRGTFLEEEVPLEKALGRVLARDLTSPENVPGFDNSAMDGFAVRSADTAAASPAFPVRLGIIGSTAAGDPAARVRAKGGVGEPAGSCAIEIMTGAAMPGAPFDSVVKVEDARREGDFVILHSPARAGAHVRPAGTDFALGQSVVREGAVFSLEHFLACATLGLDPVPVRSRARVAVVSTGSELVDFREKSLAPSMIRNSTGPYLLAALESRSVEWRWLGRLRDEPDVFSRRVSEAVDGGADLVISTGAVSMGRHDFVMDVLARDGWETLFHKTAIRPGKPLCLAWRKLSSGRRVVFFGVPGNPVSTAVGLRFFVDPYLKAWEGLAPERPGRARLVRTVAKPEGLRCFYKAVVRTTKGALEAEPTAGQESYRVATLAEANAWVVLPAEGESCLAGSDVEVWPLHGAREGAPWFAST